MTSRELTEWIRAEDFRGDFKTSTDDAVELIDSAMKEQWQNGYDEGWKDAGGKNEHA